MRTKIKAVFVGASAGGVTAVQTILSTLPDQFSLPLVIVQHLPQNFQMDAAQAFGRYTRRQLNTVMDKMLIESNHVYFAPPGYHLLLESTHEFALSQDEAVHFARPSIDVAFESAALAFGASACAVLLTGANEDGATGLKMVQQFGGVTMVQDPQEAEAPMMPLTALQRLKPDFVGTLEKIAVRLVEVSGGRVG